MPPRKTHLVHQQAKRSTVGTSDSAHGPVGSSKGGRPGTNEHGDGNEKDASGADDSKRAGSILSQTLFSLLNIFF